MGEDSKNSFIDYEDWTVIRRVAENVIATLITISLLTIGGWLIGEVSTHLLIISSVIIGILILVVLAIRRYSTTAIRTVEPYEALINDLERVALARHGIDYPKEIINEGIDLERVEGVFEIDGINGHYRYRYMGENSSDRSIPWFKQMVAGDSPIDDRNMLGLDVESHEDNHRNVSIEITGGTIFEKIFTVTFSPALESGEPFDISVTCDWPYTFTRKKEYVFLPTNTMPDVNSAKLELQYDTEISEFTGFVWSGEEYIVADNQPLPKPSNKIVWEIPNPKELHLIAFTRTKVPQVTQD